jgi:hypothetical protein
MRLRYRGIVYKCYSPGQPISESAQILRYRGLYYVREMYSPDLSRISTPISSTKGSVWSDTAESYILQISRMGLLYKLYCIGWRHSSLKHLSALQHWALSLFVDYRKGYAAGLQWRQHCSE